MIDLDRSVTGRVNERENMYRFFVEPSRVGEKEIRIGGEDVNHIKNVLRMRPGEKILICTGDEWEYTCEVKELEQDVVRAEILDAQKPGKELQSRIRLYQCLPKGDKMELIIQKAVELGTFSVVPVRSARCIVKLDDKKAAARVERWNAIAESAAKQSKRMIIPQVERVMGLKEALKDAAACDVRLMPYENEAGMARTREVLEGIVPGQSVAVLIGPEGGFSPEEAELARESGFLTITLGKRILRTETAGMTVIAILMYLLEQD